MSGTAHSPQHTHSNFHFKNLGSFQLVCVNSSWCLQMVTPNALLSPLAHWYHEATVHTGRTMCLEEMIKEHLYHHSLACGIKQQIQSHDIYQCFKHFPQYLPSCQVAHPLRHEVQTDCSGPWKIKLCGGITFEIQALTSINTCTNLLEIEPLVMKTSAEVVWVFDNGWLSHYPQPVNIGRS